MIPKVGLWGRISHEPFGALTVVMSDFLLRRARSGCLKSLAPPSSLSCSHSRRVTPCSCFTFHQESKLPEAFPDTEQMQMLCSYSLQNLSQLNSFPDKLPGLRHFFTARKTEEPRAMGGGTLRRICTYTHPHLTFLICKRKLSHLHKGLSYLPRGTFVGIPWSTMCVNYLKLKNSFKMETDCGH